MATITLARAGIDNDPIHPQDYTPPIRLACVGDSITYGWGTSDPGTQGYPAQLGRLLGQKWAVGDFGRLALNLMMKSDIPYQKNGVLQEALKFNPNVVVIMLGTNDSRAKNWQFKDDFTPDYKNLIEKFKALPAQPRIFICHPVYSPLKDRSGINEPVILEEIPLIDQVAADENVGVIDLHSPLLGRDKLFPDTIHPNNEGAGILARTVYKALTGTEFEGDVPAAK